MAKNDEPHLATVLSVDVTEVSDKALERVRGAFATAVRPAQRDRGTRAGRRPAGRVSGRG